ncbi:MAG TPA: DNA-directed RNA polymerase subunit omega [Candidatus Avoscillospira stercorigallinarum]|uniref:DNA-directed RNA polymerase subunit omega n=1 Tax=Candidatus Avoscillospira stercorigallinarum TaxID=2840708 RepID=A0A9D1CNW5_9FIRM|nr:DNA-directed RNA polymerase subunit omega [Candidatus Avoscillospira stercorigallinarum]
MMLYPPMSELLKHIDSRYLLVNVVARRARQISIEAEQEGYALDDKPVTLAIREVAEGKLSAVTKEEYLR